MRDLEARIEGIETVLNKYLPGLMGKDKDKTTKGAPKPANTETGKAAGAGNSRAPAAADAKAATPAIDPEIVAAIGLKLPSYRVGWEGILITVDAAFLHENPDVLAYMKKELPECFV